MLTYNILTAADDAARVAAFDEATADVWSAFMLNDVVANRLWPRLNRDFPAYQFLMVDGEGRGIALGNSIPLRYEGELGDLPDEGWDWAIQQGFDDLEAEREPNLVSALSIKVAAEFQRQGYSYEAVRVMRQVATRHGFDRLIAPVRPSLKPRYPLIDIERYARWQRDDGLPFDPWLRVHARLGAEIVRPCPRSMLIKGSVAEWEDWAGMAFPETGTYTVPGALVPVEIDCERDEGVYVEPNVWMRHLTMAHQLEKS